MSTWCVHLAHSLTALNFVQYRDRVDREREMSPAVTGSTVRKRTASSASVSDALPKRMRPSVPSG
jgi:hypothetical protein